MKPGLRISIYFAILLITSSCIAQEAENEHKNDRFILLWESNPALLTCESVLYDAPEERLLVSCINGKSAEKDGNGFISILDKNGKIIIEKWITGLNAPKGMGLSGKSLFVSDIDVIAEFDASSGNLIRKISVESAQFLNDITVDPSGIIYFSDMKTNKLYTLKNGKYEIFSLREDIENLNGLWVIGDQLFAGGKNAVFQINISDHSMQEYVTGTGPVDGIVSDGEGNIIISDWSGKVQMINKERELITMFDGTAGKINAADLGINPQNQVLYVPTFFHNTVRAYIPGTK